MNTKSTAPGVRANAREPTATKTNSCKSEGKLHQGFSDAEVHLDSASLMKQNTCLLETERSAGPELTSQLASQLASAAWLLNAANPSLSMRYVAMSI
jgi:hypothetical protein